MKGLTASPHPSTLFRDLAGRAVGTALLALAAQATHAQTAPASSPAAPSSAAASAPLPSMFSAGSGKLLLTGGVSSIDGAAGGGLTPWAVIGSYATDTEFGATAFVTRASTDHYGLTAYGAALGVMDRLEVSVAHQALNAGAAVPGAILKLDIVGAKLKLLGNAVLDADSWLPQIAVGAEWKRVDPGAAVGGVLDSVDARRNGVDLYVSATKLFLAQGILVNGTLRATKANQNGLLGFGSSASSGYKLEPELSLAYMLRRNLAVGVEARWKPDQLAFAGAAFREDTWKDVFIAWALTKNASVTAAYVDLGNIVGHRNESGGYVSLQLGF